MRSVANASNQPGPNNLWETKMAKEYKRFRSDVKKGLRKITIVVGRTT